MDANDVPVESAKAYQAFLDYWELGQGRSLAKLAQKYGKSTAYVRQLEKWSTAYNWQDRVKQYKAEESAVKAEARQKRREEMEDRHAREAKEEQKLARNFIKEGVEEYHSISLSAVHLLKNSREDERKALGVEDAQSMAVEVNSSEDNVQVIVYYPQSKDKEA